MAYNYIDEKQLKESLNESEEYMKPFYEPLAELYRITHGKPGKVAPGKPRVTTGKLASIRRELPKQVIQQLPTGKPVIRDMPDMEEYASAVLTDIILPNANSGGDPYSKAMTAIEDCFSIGSSWMHPFFNRRGDLFHGDFKRVDVRDIGFEKGKVSEFDSNFMWMYEWLTESDIKAIIWQQQQLEKSSKERGETYEGKYNLKFLQELIDSGAKDKDDQHKTEAEKKYSSEKGYFKLAHAFQIGTGATFYTYAPAIEKVVKKCVTSDPRGVIPLHGLILQIDHANPIGEAIAAISAPKQNLLDYEMQNYQYHQAMGTDPTIKLWGSTPVSKVVVGPGKTIKMTGTKATDDFEVVDIRSQAINNFANNYGLLAGEISEEVGFIAGSSTSAESGNPNLSKTSSGVKQTDRRTSLSINDIQKKHEAWLGRIFETTLNIHFAESKGEKTLDVSAETLRRMKMTESPMLDYDQNFGRIKFTVSAGTTKASDNDAENEKLTGLLELKAKYGAQPDSKFMLMFNQIVKNSGMDDPETIQYSDDEIQLMQDQEDMLRQQQREQMEMQAAGIDPNAEEPVEEQPQADPIEEDRMLAKEQLLQRGMDDMQAEETLMAMDRGEV